MSNTASASNKTNNDGFIESSGFQRLLLAWIFCSPIVSYDVRPKTNYFPRCSAVVRL